MKILGFYISRTDWCSKWWGLSQLRTSEHERFYEQIDLLKDKLNKQSETYTGKDGRLRFKHNGQFAPDNRSKFKRVHDQLRREVAERKYVPSDQVPHYDDIKKALKLKEFGE